MKASRKQLNSKLFKFEKSGQVVTGKIIRIMDYEFAGTGNICKKYTMKCTDDNLIQFFLGAATDATLPVDTLVGMDVTVIYQGKIDIPGGRSMNNFLILEGLDAENLS